MIKGLKNSKPFMKHINTFSIWQQTADISFYSRSNQTLSGLCPWIPRVCYHLIFGFKHLEEVPQNMYCVLTAEENITMEVPQKIQIYTFSARLGHHIFSSALPLLLNCSTCSACKTCRTGFKFMANKQLRMQKKRGTSVSANISHYALKNQYVQFV